jgi:ribosomal protein S18 acetylase RimI-like enzyme
MTTSPGTAKQAVMSQMLPHLRRAGPSDAAAIAALTEAAYSKWVPVVGRKPLPMLVDYDIAVVDHRVDLLEREGALVALIEMAPADDHLLIVNLAVAPDAQRQGVGTLLLAHAERVARQLGVGELRLFTNSLMTSNVALYQRNGYRITEIEPRAAGWGVVHMAKPVTPP